MAKPLYSASWYRVAELRPRPRPHIQIHRQVFRGEVWYVVQDHQTGQFHRLSAAAHYVLSQMDGRRTIETIWQRASERLGEDQPTQHEVVQLLAQLHAADLIVGDVAPDLAEAADRSAKKARQAWLARVRNPLALRFPLIDPDRLLEATLPLVRPLFTVWGFVAWLALVLSGATLAVMHWRELGADVVDQTLTAQNLLLIALAYPVLKCLHELGHGYATKVWGGEVHEMGIMVLVLMPVPYMDASSSTGFRERWRRVVVGGAGIMVELALAAAAMVVWVSAEPGLVRAVAFNVALICGVSTVLFNGNPLLRFDGYYVFSDLIGIPNLGGRANKYVFYLIERYGFGVRDAESPITAPGERGWLFGYAVAAFFYRLAIMLVIALFIASQLFFIGVALAVVSVVATVVWPLLKGIYHVAASPRLHRHRPRAVAVSAGVLLAVIVPAVAVPLPYATSAQGVVWVGDAAAVRAATDGVVVTVPVASGTRIEPGTALVVAQDAVLAATQRVFAHQLAELEIRLEAVRLSDLVQASLLREQMRHLEGQIAANRRQYDGLSVTASRAGVFLASDLADLPGRFVRRGDIIGYVVGEDDPIVRVVVPQADVDLVRRFTQSVTVRLADRPERVLTATALRDVPAALTDLPHPALATTGGGPVLLDPSSPERPRPLEPLYLFDLRVDGGELPFRLGGRVHVRFAHPDTPLALRLARAARQLFLRQFGV